MKITKLQVGIIIFFALAISFMLMFGRIRQKKLIQNHKISNAQIIDYSYGGRGHEGTITFI